MTPSAFKDFHGAVEEHFVTALVGVLPGDESLKGAHNGSTSFEGNVMRSDVTSYKSITFSDSANRSRDDDPLPKYHYDYTLTLWDRNGAQKPDSYEATYHEPK